MKCARSIYSMATLMLVVASTGCASYRACPGSECTADDDTTAAVDAAIVQNTDLGPPSQIEVSTFNHVVYLDGIVDTEYQRSEAEAIAGRSDHGAKIVNSIALSN
jgi:osmotically-inducible protein OsmY